MFCSKFNILKKLLAVGSQSAYRSLRRSTCRSSRLVNHKLPWRSSHEALAASSPGAQTWQKMNEITKWLLLIFYPAVGFLFGLKKGNSTSWSGRGEVFTVQFFVTLLVQVPSTRPLDNQVSQSNRQDDMMWNSIKWKSSTTCLLSGLQCRDSDHGEAKRIQSLAAQAKDWVNWWKNWRQNDG